jgi:hypothetical protein
MDDELLDGWPDDEFLERLRAITADSAADA